MGINIITSYQSHYQSMENVESMFSEYKVLWLLCFKM